jgi:putative ABC transport system permease protein
LNEASFTVVGVLPPNFQPLSLSAAAEAEASRDIFAPLGYARGQQDACRGCQHLRLVARLKPGIGPGQASAELNTIMRDIVREHPQSYDPAIRVMVTPLADEVVGQKVRAGLWLLSAAVVFVLLIACANIANLLLARASVRLKEITVRAALGATRARLIRQLLTESLLLAAIGGVAGVMQAAWGTRILASIAPHEIPRIAEVRIDVTVLLFGLAASLCAGIAFGLAPAARVSRVDLNDAIKSSGKSTAGRGRSGFRSALVITQWRWHSCWSSESGCLRRAFCG